jgi:hypothetical protein
MFPRNKQVVFYFYNPTTVALKIRIQKIWGDRSPKGNWRIPTSALNTVASDSLTWRRDACRRYKTEKFVEQYTTDFI